MPKIFKTYKVEGVGEDFLPETMDLSIIDDVVQVSDKDCFVTARELAREEGILTGGSGGMALFAARKIVKKLKKGIVVVILPDSGKNYLTKFYNDYWMRDFGFLDEVKDSIKPLLNKKLHFISVSNKATPYQAIEILRKYNISQLPVVDEKKNVVGIVNERTLVDNLFEKPKIPVTVTEIMDSKVKQLCIGSTITDLARALKEKEMVVITDKKGKAIDVLTRIDLLSQLS